MKYIALIMVAMSVSGCASFSLFDKVKPVTVETKAAERPPLNLSLPEPSRMNPVDWYVITPQNAEEVWKRIESSNSKVVLYGITTEDYQKLAVDMLALRQYIEKQNLIIKQYKDYYEVQAVPAKP